MAYSVDPDGFKLGILTKIVNFGDQKFAEHRKLSGLANDCPGSTDDQLMGTVPAVPPAGSWKIVPDAVRLKPRCPVAPTVWGTAVAR